MGAGLWPAGVGPCGFDPVQYVGSQATKPPPQALIFTAGTGSGGSFVQNADGTMAATDSVDAAVCLMMGIEYGSIPSAPTTGNKYRRVLNRIPKASLLAAAQTETLRWAALIGPTRIQILQVIVDATYWKLGSTRVGVTYLNLTKNRRSPAWWPAPPPAAP
jgi:hypothetical protein